MRPHAGAKRKNNRGKTLEPTENQPSLINCLEKGTHGFFLDAIPAEAPPVQQPPVLQRAPYTKIIAADIKTDGNNVLQRVLLVMQRDDYDISDALVPLNNPHIEKAWQQAAAFHQSNDSEKQPLFFKQQFDQTGRLQPHQPLFRCTHADRWFHPACPQCGQLLTLCQDDSLLEKSGVPTYSASHDRFLYCRACVGLSDSPFLYVRRKYPGMPEQVLDKDQLVAQWKLLAGKLPPGNGLPCEGCSQIDVCWKNDSKAGERIDCFSFYPFFMLMTPAPSCRGDHFIRMISGDSNITTTGCSRPAADPVGQCFFFEGRDRLFLEILYLKLTFLSQLCRQYLAGDGPEMDLSLESIGVDLSPSGTGLPGLWQFNVRFLNLVGCNQPSPFAPVVPIAPRLHFLGTVWMRTLLVNSVQNADSVFPEIARIIETWPADTDGLSLPIDTADPDGPLAAGQIFWEPKSLALPPAWQDAWVHGLRLGLSLLNAGLKTGQAWDAGHFINTLDDLREHVRNNLTARPGETAVQKTDVHLPADLRAVLGEILDKWKNLARTTESRHLVSDDDVLGVDAGQRDAPPPLEPKSTLPPETMVQEDVVPSPSANRAQPAPIIDLQESEGPMADWQDPDQTIVLNQTIRTSTPSTAQDEISAASRPDASWDSDADQTVVWRPGDPLPEASTPARDMDATIVTSPASISAGSVLSKEDANIEAPRHQQPPTPVADVPEMPSGFIPSGGFENDLEATVVINPTAPAADPQIPPPLNPQIDDGDLAATLIQGANQPPAMPPSPPSPTEKPLQAASPPEDDLEATMVINPADRTGPPGGHVPAIPSDDDLEATLIETPRSGFAPESGMPPLPPTPPPLPTLPSQEMPPPMEGAHDSNDAFDDDVMEQTIMIGSTNKKE
ncbi:MAG: hypothetical protein CR984_03575 [Proteobacteria bacterium]|nr:MAG: hypothetical protein CR984_03575 [Pseudomonadota bacterium]